MGINQNQLKVQLKLAVNRLKMLQQKKRAINGQQRKEVATLMEAKKYDSARIRTEHVIRDDFFTEALEMLEMLCDMLLARIGLLEAKQCDPAIQEPVYTLIYAAARASEVKELAAIRAQLVSKFGKDLVEQATRGEGAVNAKVAQRMSLQTPNPDMVTSYLREIASTFKVQVDEAALAPPADKQDAQPIVSQPAFIAKPVLNIDGPSALAVQRIPVNHGSEPPRYKSQDSISMQSSSAAKPSIPALPDSPVKLDSLQPRQMSSDIPQFPEPPKDGAEGEGKDGGDDDGFDALAERLERLKGRP